MLKNSLEQSWPYQGQSIRIANEWLRNEIAKKIEALDWQEVANDVKKFLPNNLVHTVKTWDKDLFLALLKKLD